MTNWENTRSPCSIILTIDVPSSPFQALHTMTPPQMNSASRVRAGSKKLGISESFLFFSLSIHLPETAYNKWGNLLEGYNLQDAERGYAKEEAMPIKKQEWMCIWCFLERGTGLSVLNAEYKRNYDIKTGINSFGQDGGKGIQFTLLPNQPKTETKTPDKPTTGKKKRNWMKPERGRTTVTTMKTLDFAIKACDPWDRKLTRRELWCPPSLYPWELPREINNGVYRTQTREGKSCKGRSPDL